MVFEFEKMEFKSSSRNVYFGIKGNKKKNTKKKR